MISTAEWIPGKRMTSLSRCKAVLYFHLVIQFKTESFHIRTYVSHGGVYRVSHRKLPRCVMGTRARTGVECTFRIVDNPVATLHCVSHPHLALYTQHTSTTLSTQFIPFQHVPLVWFSSLFPQDKKWWELKIKIHSKTAHIHKSIAKNMNFKSLCVNSK